MTFPLQYSDEKEGVDGRGPAKIESFVPILTERGIVKDGDSWYATDDRPERAGISAHVFRKAFLRFQSIHEEASGWALDSFSNRKSFAFEWEGYKQAIPDRAGAILNANKWTRKEIGSGDILKRVIAAIELPDNNLLQWQARQGPDSRAHSRLYDLQKDVLGRHEVETLFYDLYRNGRADHAIFEGITKLCGKRYELLGYLFFIADPGNYLPIRTRSFDRALAELGVDLKTEGRCGWENYLNFVTVIREVRVRLLAEGIADATLLDAHSFCWILSRHEASDHGSDGEDAVLMELFEGRLRPYEDSRKFSVNDEALIRDMQGIASRRVASGQVAEDIALKAERNRLCSEGFPDLGEKVESVANRPGLGYDIKSFESDGSERFIEVKNVSSASRFFLSEGEWLNSRERTNYWFYLVSETGKSKPVVSMMPAESLEKLHLRPVNFLVSFE